MKKHNTKDNIFEAWDELIFLLEYLERIVEDKEIIRGIIATQLLKKEKWELFYERMVWNVIESQQLITNNCKVTKTLILKWEELIIESYFYLQQARKSGGTLGHKIGPIWSFHKREKEKYENIILKLDIK
jgi:hypothetical protein